MAIPALAAKDFAAASFLALAATQFREVRNIERETLLNLEESELVPRGKAYIEGIARVFEARNYLAMVTAFVTSGTAVLVGGVWESLTAAVAAGGLAGVLVWLVVKRGVRGPHIGRSRRVEPRSYRV